METEKPTRPALRWALRSTAHTAAENTSPFPRSSRLAASHLRGGQGRGGQWGPSLRALLLWAQGPAMAPARVPMGGHGLFHTPGRTQAQWMGEVDTILSRLCTAQGLAHSRCSAVLLTSYGWDVPSPAPLCALCLNPSPIFMWPTSHLQAQVGSNASSRSPLRLLLPFFPMSLTTCFVKVISLHNSTIQSVLD